MIKTYQLKNKAHVYIAPQADATSVTFLVMFPVGSRFEPTKLQGVSHYIEHMMFKGTKKRKSSFILTREIDRLGAAYNAFTGKEYTGYYIHVGVDYTETALDILSDMLFNSVFDPKEMEKEKLVIVEEIKMYNDNPLMNIQTLFERVMFDGCPLGPDIAGTAEHVLSYTRPDVLAYRKKFYSPDNIHIIVAGAQHPKLPTLIESYFGKSVKSPGKKTKPLPAVFGSAAKGKRLLVDKKDVEQVQLMLGYPAFKTNDYTNVATLQVLNTILGGSMSSRLFVRIREQLGLAYMVRSGVEEFADTGYTFVRAGLDPKKVNKAIAAIKKEIEKIKVSGVTKQELVDAKTHTRGAMSLSMESSAELASWYSRPAIYGGILMTPQQWVERIEKVTQADVQRVAKKVFVEEKMRLAIIGNISKDDIQW